MSDTPAVIDLKVADAGYTKDLYSSTDCYVGYKFVRFEVDGVVKPCCGYPHSVGNFLEENWQRIWHSAAMLEFRRKTAKMSVGKWHITTPEWSFCQNCSHRTLNVDADQQLKLPILGVDAIATVKQSEKPKLSLLDWIFSKARRFML